MFHAERANRIIGSHLGFSSKEQQAHSPGISYTRWCCEQRRAESPTAYNHGTVQQLMLRANTDWKPNRRITMAPYKCWCWEQRRAESPIRIQPRAAPRVKRFQQTCALKEQKEGTNEHLAVSCCAYSAPI